MLRPIPQSLLGDIATIKVCAGIDRYQHAIWDETVVQHVHLQNTNEVKKTRDNKEAVSYTHLFECKYSYAGANHFPVCLL